MTDPREHALQVIRETLERDPQILIAMQYLDMLKPGCLLPLKKDDEKLISRIAEMEPAPEPKRSAFYPARVEMDPVSGSWSATPLSSRGTERPWEVDRDRRDREDREIAVLQRRAALYQRNSRSPIHPETGRSLFSMWMEKEIPFSPEVMGWTNDDPRAIALMKEQE